MCLCYAKYTFTNMRVVSPICHGFAINSLDSLFLLRHFIAKPKANDQKIVLLTINVFIDLTTQYSLFRIFSLPKAALPVLETKKILTKYSRMWTSFRSGTFGGPCRTCAHGIPEGYILFHCLCITNSYIFRRTLQHS